MTAMQLTKMQYNSHITRWYPIDGDGRYFIEKNKYVRFVKYTVWSRGKIVGFCDTIAGGKLLIARATGTEVQS